MLVNYFIELHHFHSSLLATFSTRKTSTLASLRSLPNVISAFPFVRGLAVFMPTRSSRVSKSAPKYQMSRKVTFKFQSFVIVSVLAVFVNRLESGGLLLS